MCADVIAPPPPRQSSTCLPNSRLGVRQLHKLPLPGICVTGTKLRYLLISAARLASHHPGNKRRRVLAANQSRALIDRVVLRPRGSGVAGRLRPHPSPPSPRAGAPLTGGDALEDNNKAGMWREISGAILLD